jgi:hypothetical protein
MARASEFFNYLTELLIFLHGMDNQVLQRVRQAGYCRMAG